ncbi:hypothetical protein N7488_005065 [Penicillium malachiteum]|nr:hypothetical protein N7488_005065 [Penicillium malachiteum]
MVPELCEGDALHLSVLGPSRSRMPTGRGTRGRPANWKRAWLDDLLSVWDDGGDHSWLQPYDRPSSVTHVARNGRHVTAPCV